VRSLKLRDYFKDKPNDDYDFNEKTFTHRSTWTPADHKLCQPTLDTVQQIMETTERIIHERRVMNGRLLVLNQHGDNLTPEERDALRQLRTNNEIVIKPADKGSATVVMNKDAYVKEALRQLNNAAYYRRLNQPIFRTNIPKVNAILDDMLSEGFISEKQQRYLRASDSDRERVFYLLPKIHKPREKWPQPDVMPEGRPIVSDTGSESYRVSQYIDSFIRPISIRHPSFIKDTYDFVSKIRFKRIPKHAFLVTGDVSSLYTNMRIDRTLSTTRSALEKHPMPGRPDRHLLRLLELTLRNNDFSFNDQFYLQICGIAMGKGYAPGLADIYMEEFDEQAMYGFRYKPLLFFRYLDDIFFVWTGSETELREYEQHLNSLIDGIKVTLNWSQESVDFLDTTVYKRCDGNEDVLQTRVFFKPTDTHQLLHKSSFHPRHTTRGLLKSQLLRFRRISTTFDDYDASCRILFRTLARRNYSRSLMRKMKREVWRNCDTSVSSSGIKSNNILPVVVPYNEAGTELSRLWRNIINQNDLFKETRLITAYTTGRSLRRSLVRSSMTTTINQNRRSTSTNRTNKCSRCTNIRCKACNRITSGVSFTSTSNCKRFSVIGSITCKSTNIIYLVTCRNCRKQYVGETGRTFADRINDHLSGIRLRKKTPIGIHFNTSGHRIEDFTIMGIEQLDDRDAPEVRRMKEITWQNLLQTAYPLGINNLKEYYV
jgi:GIY-YIG catalytic domain